MTQESHCCYIAKLIAHCVSSKKMKISPWFLTLHSQRKSQVQVRNLLVPPTTSNVPPPQHQQSQPKNLTQEAAASYGHDKE
jgi:hypothetical protein